MNLSETIGLRLKSLRTEKNMSLGQLSEVCGISKVMLSQIEKGVSNPTINTLWKIANGLQVPYAELIAPPMEETEVVSCDAAKMQYSPDGKCRIFCYFPKTAGRSQEIFLMELSEGAVYTSPGHSPNSREYLLVCEGSLTLEHGGIVHHLKQGDALSFAASAPHIYRSSDHSAAKIYIINTYSS